MADEFEETLTSGAEPSSTPSASDDLTKLFADSLNASAEAQPQAPQALNDGANAEPQPSAAPDAEPAPALNAQAEPPSRAQERIQELIAERRQVETQLEQQRAYTAQLAEASEYGISIQDHNAYSMQAQQQGFPDTRSYLNYLVEYQRQENALAEVQNNFDVPDAYKQTFEQLTRQGQQAAQQLAKLQVQNDRRESQDRASAVTYAQQQLGFDKLPPRLMEIFNHRNTSPEVIRALVDDLKPHWDAQQEAKLNAARSEWATKDAARRTQAAPVSANAGGSMTAQAAYTAANPPPLKSLFKI